MHEESRLSPSTGVDTKDGAYGTFLCSRHRKDFGKVDDVKTATPVESWELNGAFKHPESDWKEKLVTFLDSVRTLSCHTRNQHPY
jgi:hypothetical protein